MRLKALLADDENAVSPVIGVILMVAITVILAAVIASFVLGLGPSDAAPTVNFDNEFDSSADGGLGSVDGGLLSVSVAGGDTVEADKISFGGDQDGVLVGSGDAEPNGTWLPANATGSSDGNPALAASDEVNVLINSTGDYEVPVVWESDGTSQTLTTFEGTA